VHAIPVRVGFVGRSASVPLPVLYALDTVLDEFSLEPIVFRDGGPEPVHSGTGEEDVDFPDPVGAARLLHAPLGGCDVPALLPRLCEASFRVAFQPEFTRKMRLLVDLGLASKKKPPGGT
jgi:hypothetical protein